MTGTPEGRRAAPPDLTPQPWPGLLLSGVAGAVDGVGYLLVHVFTAHVTGNTVHLGTDLGRLQLGDAARAAYAIALFAAGTAIGATLRDRCAARGLPARALVLAVALAALASFTIVGTVAARTNSLASPGPFLVLAGCATLAMGLQNAVPPVVSGRRIRPFLTGTVTDAVEALVLAARSSGGGPRRDALRHAGALVAVWTAYVFGAFFTGAAATRWGAAAALLPMAGLTAVAIGDFAASRESSRV